MYNSINTEKDIELFLEKSNSLHDGYIIGVQFVNEGIIKIEGGHYITPEKTRLWVKVLVTSIYDTVIEIEFENISEWQIKDNQWEITDTSVFFNEQNCIVWTGDVYINDKEMKSHSYVIAKSMKWRISEY